MRDRTENRYLFPCIFHTSGALIPGVVVRYLDPTAVVHPYVLSVFPELFAESLFTVALAYVVINTATAKRHLRNCEVVQDERGDRSVFSHARVTRKRRT
ncbi:MAG TPA: hypothetical protein VGM27_10170 [Acidobacteriaceae bacterium]